MYMKLSEAVVLTMKLLAANDMEPTWVKEPVPSLVLIPLGAPEPPLVSTPQENTPVVALYRSLSAVVPLHPVVPVIALSPAPKKAEAEALPFTSKLRLDDAPVVVTRNL